jgi:squalene-associated FAD-dependent desaturase
MSLRVVVVGGGLAGISAALGLASAGWDVTLLEARPRLGGAASSSRRGDLAIDTGQHVFLRCCTSYRGLLDRLGVADSVALQERFDVTVLSASGRARLRRSALPSPLHLGGALARYRPLPVADRLRVGRAAAAMRSVDPADPAADGVRLGDWLAARGQGEHARRSLWDLFVVSALNIAGDDASLALAATVIKTALLSARDAADIGTATVPLGQLHDAAPAAVLGRLGARVLVGTKVAAVERGFRVVAGEAEWPADGVVLAVPPEAAARLAGAAGVTDAPRWAGLGSSPIVNVHVVFDRRVTDLPFAAAVNSPVQWLFDKTAQSGLAADGGQYLAISLSAADEWIDVPAARLREVFVPELGRLLPAAASARVTDFFVTRERRATFRQAPGTAELRPGTATSVPGLVLAGAWTRTGWPDTMEGAVRSGENAARELTAQLGGRGLRAPMTAGAQQ